MNILFLTNKAPYPPKDGGSIATFGLINAIADHGHNVTVLAMNTAKHHITPFEIPDEVKAKIAMHLVEVPAHISIQGLIKNLLFSKLPYNAERFVSRRYKQKLSQLLQHQEFDVIQLEGLYLIPYVPVIRKYSKALIAYRSHNIEYEIWERSAEKAGLLKKPYLKILSGRLKRFEVDSINQYDLLVAITERDRLKLIEFGNTKESITISSGVEAKEVERREPAKNTLGFIGALDWYPNQEGLQWFLENCWGDIVEKKPETKLYVAGRNAPDWFVDKLKLPNLEYLGEVDNAYQFMNDYQVLIAPLLSGSGMRIKLVEGMAQTKAIVTTTIGCEGIPIENEKQLYVADNPVKFSEYCLQLLNSQNKCNEIGSNALKFVSENYDNKVLSQKLIECFVQLSK